MMTHHKPLLSILPIRVFASRCVVQSLDIGQEIESRANGGLHHKYTAIATWAPRSDAVRLTVNLSPKTYWDTRIDITGVPYDREAIEW